MDLAETRRLQQKIDVGPPISIIVPGKETRPLDVGERSSPSVQAVVLQPGSDFSLPVVGQLCRLWQATPQGGFVPKLKRYERVQWGGVPRKGGRGVIIYISVI